MGASKQRALLAGAAAAALLLVLPQPAGSAEPADEEAALIREIIRVTGAEQIGVQMTAMMIGQLKQAFPQVPEAIWTEFQASLDPREMTELSLPVYAKHFTAAELRELLGFYGTPLGQKMIREMPAVMQESTALGGEWGRRKMEDIVRRLADKGFQPAQI